MAPGDSFSGSGPLWRILGELGISSEPPEPPEKAKEEDFLRGFLVESVKAIRAAEVAVLEKNPQEDPWGQLPEFMRNELLGDHWEKEGQ